ncbi:G/U mismatch-specific DNA glycosylase [Umezawaea beigongshangensis]|uniref:G/U mismatch-specific DNA glycosylase n=1 Tax=Umezawaea beigongshangensis TaxID=2780383 RepID=UPI0018F163A7|nr:G/U mismatch-specific DNA glycosylase [Umezawaea beigongshangensis]
MTPTRDQLAEAKNLTLPDVVGPGLDVLFCGINPGLYSAATGHHFGRPGNRFWPALHLGGFTPRQFEPSEQDLLPELGLGITNLVARATARADELSDEELRAGGKRLVALALEHRPRAVAVVGVTAYRAAFGRKHAKVGPQQERVGESPLWVLPNPSGLNAHYGREALGAEFRALREALPRGW